MPARFGRVTSPIIVFYVLLGAILLPVAPAQAAVGDLDPTFSGDGKELTNVGGGDYGQDVATQADGKLVLVGGTHSGVGGGHDFAVVRHNADGSLDTSFSDDGTQTTDVGNGAAYGVVIQPDGKIVAAGSAGGGFALARYNLDGSLDTAFGADGVQKTDVGNGVAYDVAIQSDGKIVAVGYASVGAGPADFAIARFNADGSLDTTFDGDGQQTTEVGGVDVASSVALQSDGRIVVAGYAPGFDFADLALARYNADGSLDTSFSGDGTQITDVGDEDRASDVAIQPDGKIVAVGSTYSFIASSTAFVVARYNLDGSRDSSFGAFGGFQLTGLSGTDYASGVALQPDGKIVVVGDASGDFAVARYQPNGAPDATFSGDGAEITDFGGGDVTYDEAQGVALDPHGKIVAAGTTYSYDPDGVASGDFALARYQVAPEPDETAPETVISAGPGGTTNDPTPVFRFESSEAGSTFECRVDGDGFSPCGSPHATAPLNDGAHSFEVRAIDSAGNRDSSPAGRGFSIDAAPPETTIHGGPTGTTTDSTAIFTFSSSEAGSSFECRIDGASFVACSTPYTSSSLGNGAHTFEVRATDAAGNADATAAARSWTIAPDYRRDVLAADGLVSYWRLGETSGTNAADAKGPNEGSYRNGVALGRPSALLADANPSAGFDGVNDFVDIADHASLDTGDRFTLEAWIKRSSPSQSTATVLSKGSGAWRLSFVKNVLTLGKGGSAPVAAASIATTDTTGFHHVVATRSGASVRLYIDGVDRTGKVTNRSTSGTDAALNIGRYTSGSEHFAGLIDEVAIYRVALSDTQVRQHYIASGR